MNALVGKLRRMAEDKALPIGDAWNALDEAADALEQAQALIDRLWECGLRPTEDSCGSEPTNSLRSPAAPLVGSPDRSPGLTPSSHPPPAP